MFQLSFSGTCAHSAALCSSVGVLQGTSELAALPPMSYSLHTKSLDTCAKCCLSVHGTLIFLVAFHCDALRGSDSTDSTDYGHTKSFQENFLEMSQNCIFKWHLEHERLKPSSQQTFPWSWLVVLKMNFVFLGYSWERELLSVAVRLWGRFSFLVLNFGSKESLFISHHYPELFFALFFFISLSLICNSLLVLLLSSHSFFPTPFTSGSYFTVFILCYTWALITEFV